MACDHKGSGKDQAADHIARGNGGAHPAAHHPGLVLNQAAHGAYAPQDRAALHLLQGIGSVPRQPGRSVLRVQAMQGALRRACGAAIHKVSVMDTVSDAIDRADTLNPRLRAKAAMPVFSFRHRPLSSRVPRLRK